MKKFEFTYTIKQIDLQHGDVLIEYLPTNPSLTKYIWNVGAYGRTETGELKTIEQTILDNAPHGMWETQEMLLSIHDNILNKTETINPNV